MDSPFKKFQQALRDDSAEQLPADFSWEAMQTGIHSKMEALEKAKKEKRRRFFWWYGLGLLLALLLGGGGFYLINENSAEEQGNSSVQTDSEQPIATAPTELKERSQVSSAAEHSTPRLVVPSNPINKPESDSGQKSRQQDNSALPTRLPNAIKASTAAKSLDQSSSPVKQALPTLQPGSSPQAAIANPLRNDQTISALPTLSFAVEASDWASEVVLNQLLPKEIPFTNPFDKAGWRIGFFGGTNRGSSQPITLANEQVKAEETGLFAPYFQLQLERSFNQNFFARGGLRWQQTHSFLHYNSTTSGSTLVQDVVLLRSINTSTGDTTTLLRGDTLLASSSQRSLGQLNSRISLQIPLSLGYKKSFGRWEVALNAGAVLELRQRNAGLFPTTDGSIQALENYPNDGQPNPLSVHLQAGVDLGYRISPRLLLGLQTNLQQQGKGWHPSNLHTRRPTLLSFGVGAVWRL